MSNLEPPADFLAALHSIRAALPLPGIHYEEVPSPPGLARYAAGIRIESSLQVNELPIATGTFVTLYDPSQAEIWGGNFRLVAHSRIQIDEEMSLDPLLAEFLWVSLTQQLRERTESFENLVGTVTKELSESFGGLHLHGSTFNADVRCSWSTTSTTAGRHLAAWSKFVLESAGIPPEMRTTLKVHNA